MNARIDPPRRTWRPRILLTALGLTVTGALAASSASLATPVAPAVPAAATFSYTGAQQIYAVPRGVKLALIDAVGGDGGSSGGSGGGAMNIEGYAPTSSGQKLYVEVGQAGAANGRATFGGGGAAGANPPYIGPCNLNENPSCGGAYAGSGGGASDVRTCSEHAVRCAVGGSSARSRLIVAGGGGGAGGGGDAPGPTCGGSASDDGNAYNPQPLPAGNPSEGPVPIPTAAGLVIPGFDNQPAFQDGTPARGGTTGAGAGGVVRPCGYSFDSIAGSGAVGPNGGTGGNASTLSPPAGGGFDAGAGGGGGGGYTGGGGGATGYGDCMKDGNPCNGVGSGQGGAAGSSFISKSVGDAQILFDPQAAIVAVTPVVEIRAPASGARYKRGRRVVASYACLNKVETACRGSVANGSRLPTGKLGHRTFKVTISVVEGSKPITVSVKYDVVK